MLSHPKLASPSAVGAGSARSLLLAVLLSLVPMSALAVTVEWDVGSGGNGHLYEVVLFPSPITWDQALADAQARGGDLASIASTEENDFVFGLIDAPEYWAFTGIHNYGPWIGGLQEDLGSEPAGGWAWTDGTAWGFTAWAASQPDNAGGLEHHAHYFVPADARGSTWNDWTGPGLLIHSYVWESDAPAACGDDVQNAGEECDDGNTLPGDGCDEQCLIESKAEPCPSAPMPGCLVAAKASVVVVEKKAGRERLKARLEGFDGPSAQGDLGNPVTGATRYDLCLYDGADQLIVALGVDRSGQRCGPKQKPCWQDQGGRAWSYKDPAAAASGVKKIGAVSGAIGKGKVTLQAGNNARKGQTALPTGTAAALQGAGGATVQVLTSDAECFTAGLGTVKKSQADLFKARAP